MSFFLAVDAGGTKTDYVLADATRVLARVRTGTIKRMRTDAEYEELRYCGKNYQMSRLVPSAAFERFRRFW